METGTALILITVLFLTVTHRGFRQLAIATCLVGIVVAAGAYVRIQYVQQQRADEYQVQQTERQAQQSREQIQQSLDGMAKLYVDAWSKDKPYFQSVRGEMVRLIQSGEVPLLPDGMPDLDGAYNKAIEPILVAKYPWIAPPPAAQPVQQWLPGQNAKPDALFKPKFAELTYCSGIGARNVSDKSCCPLDYQWSNKDNKCKLSANH